MAHTMATGPESSKRALRAELLGRRAALSRRDGAKRSRGIAGRVHRLSAWKRSHVILAYAAFRGEADPAPLVRRALAEGRVVALPRVLGPPPGRGARLAFHRITAETRLAPGRFGIPEPPDNPATLVDPGEADLVLVPGVAFSPYGDRLGYGGGYYDALLPGTAAVAVGLAFEFQVLAGVPREPRDAPVDAVVTEERVRFGRGRRHSLRSSVRVPPTKN
ncbi:MAG: 5-formyltetrahydrofolate cyclo-ligase [Candidatus Coatesbacteria bacterium]